MPSKIFNQVEENEIKRLSRGGSSGISWSLIDFTGSNVEDIITRPHSSLQNLQWSLAGHSIDTDVDFDGNTIANLGGFSEGSIIFQGASGLVQDSSNLFWDDTNSRLGVGIITPDARFHAKSSGNTSATYATKIQNSDSTDLLNIGDDGRLYIPRYYQTGIPYMGTNGEVKSNHTYLKFSDTNQWLTVSNGTNKIQFKGNNGSISAQSNTIFTPQVQVRSYYDGASAGYVNFGKARGTIASPSAVQINDQLGTFIGQAYSPNGNWKNSAWFSFNIGTTPTGDIVPGNVNFYAMNSSGTTSNILQLKHDQDVKIGGAHGGSSRLLITARDTTSAYNALQVQNASFQQLITIRNDGGFAFKGGTVGLAQTGYTTFSNLNTDRTCDTDSTTVEELADILGTLIEDLKTKGIISN